MADKKTAIPSIEERQQALEMLRVSNQQLELTTIALDKLITTVEAGLSRQYHKRLKQNGRTVSSRATS